MDVCCLEGDAVLPEVGIVPLDDHGGYGSGVFPANEDFFVVSFGVCKDLFGGECLWIPEGRALFVERSGNLEHDAEGSGDVACGDGEGIHWGLLFGCIVLWMVIIIKVVCIW